MRKFRSMSGHSFYSFGSEAYARLSDVKAEGRVFCISFPKVFRKYRKFLLAKKENTIFGNQR